ncbi:MULTISPECIES: VOC family protein [Arthrobacter]|uniref:VOC family protein n=2 Tax=Arthrobacter TaxID=1663 RepID=A0ABU9KTC0_9MICC|nr:VOC family protein [Arthrobacter sp. YJM1]MDP5228720.1 VOC family protein [Arthrobacter sp. YJM1]
MAHPLVYIHFPGTARQALEFYQRVFGGELQLNTFAEFGRDDGPGDSIAHGMLSGLVELGGADAAGEDRPLRSEGLMLSLLGTAPAEKLTAWFGQLAEHGRVVEPLEVRPWGATDGQVVDRFGVHWLVGFEN